MRDDGRSAQLDDVDAGLRDVVLRVCVGIYGRATGQEVACPRWRDGRNRPRAAWLGLRMTPVDRQMMQVRWSIAKGGGKTRRLRRQERDVGI